MQMTIDLHDICFMFQFNIIYYFKYTFKEYLYLFLNS